MLGTEAPRLGEMHSAEVRPIAAQTSSGIATPLFVYAWLEVFILKSLAAWLMNGLEPSETEIAFVSQF